MPPAAPALLAPALPTGTDPPAGRAALTRRGCGQVCSSSSMAPGRRSSEGAFGIPASDSAPPASTGMAGSRRSPPLPAAAARARPARGSAVTRVPAPLGVSPRAARGHGRLASPWQPGGSRASLPPGGPPRSFACGLPVGCRPAAPLRDWAARRFLPPCTLRGASTTGGGRGEAGPSCEMCCLSINGNRHTYIYRCGGVVCFCLVVKARSRRRS